MRSTPLSRAVTAAVLILLCLAAALAYLSAAARASHTGGMDAMSIDTDVAGNTATSLGARNNCAVVAPGANVTVDVTAENLPASNPMIAFTFDLNYPQAVATVGSAEPNFLLGSAPGSSIGDASESVPDSDGRFSVGVLDFATPEATESGSGVLMRLTISVSPQASPGQYILTLANAAHVDPLNELRFPDVLNYAFLAVDASCENLPTPTPTPEPTPTPVPPSPPPGAAIVGIDHNGPPADLNAGPAFAPPGQDTTVAVAATAPTGGIGALDVLVTYDPGVLTAVSCFPAPNVICNANYSANQVALSFVSIAGIFGTSGIADFVFHVGSASAGCSALDVAVTTAADPSANPIDSVAQDGLVCAGLPPSPSPQPSPQPSATPPPPCAPAPANDDINDGIAVSALPFTDQLDTACATTAPGDPDCFGRGATVWYSFTAPAAQRIEANTFGSDYDTTLSAYTGSPGALSQTGCNDDAGSLQSRILFDAAAGQTYYFMAGSFSDGPGGNLVLNVDIGPPPLAIDVTIDPRGLVAVKDGIATISGTVTCSGPAFVDVFGELRQKAGRAELIGFLGAFVECNGYAAWSARIEAENGKWAASISSSRQTDTSRLPPSRGSATCRKNSVPTPHS